MDKLGFGEMQAVGSLLQSCIQFVGCPTADGGEFSGLQ
jgi:hypothetical protein